MVSFCVRTAPHTLLSVVFLCYTIQESNDFPAFFDENTSRKEGDFINRIRIYYRRLQDFFARAHGLDDDYLQHTVLHNDYTITAAAVLTFTIEICMVARLFISHPAIDTPASRVYLSFYLSLMTIAGLFLLVRPRVRGKAAQSYWLQFGFVGGYLLWNVMLNTYDLYRNGSGSSLAIVMAIIFASVLVQFHPRHLIPLQCTSFLLFYALNHARIEDKINTSIAVTVAVVAGVLFYLRTLQTVDYLRRITQMNAHLEKEQMDGAKQYLRRLQETQTQTAIYRHDMRHTRYLIDQLAQQGNLEKLREFIAENQDNLQGQGVTPVMYCEHETANLILGSFAHRAAQAEIAFTCEADLPETLALADTELCALLCNLLENALHGAQKVEDPAARYILVKARVHEAEFVLSVENRFAGKVTIEDGRPQLEHPEKYHGFGVQSIINIAERHQGLYVFETQRQRFHAKVLLNLE